MSPPGSSRLAASWRLFRAVLRPAPEALTLDQLRSDLSHETAAKLARLAGLIQEWRRGSFRAGDADDAAAILQDLERIHLRHARLAAASFATFAPLTRLLGDIRSAGVRLRSRRDSVALPAPVVERLADLAAGLRRESHLLCESLSARHGARFAAIVGEAVQELRSEAGDADAGCVALTLEGASDAPRSWVPRRDARPWADVIRNLVRNAVQATEETGARPKVAGVTVRLRPLARQVGTTLEVLDEGVGMSPATVATMWQAGRSHHGGLHGQGLTEAKRAFVESRGVLEVRSVEGMGTCVRVDLPDRDVPVHAPRLWAMPPVALPLLVALALAALAFAFLVPRDIVSVEVRDGQVARALDGRGAEVWRRDLGEAVEANHVGYDPVRGVAIYRHLVLPAGWPRPENVVLSTRPAQGPGHLWRLGLWGRVVWKHTLRWNAPDDTAYTGDLRCVFQVPTWWNADGRPAIALNVRDDDWSATAIQFVNLSGDPLGAYHHPGHLEYKTSVDLDGDGRTEFFLVGQNNWAPGDTTLFPRGSAEPWVYCLLSLETPRVAGQAFPYTRWKDLPPAEEEGYLLFPPLRPSLPESLSAAVRRVTFGRPAAPGRRCVEVTLQDGRIYFLDSHLRPLACGVGSRTYASSLAPTRALAPLLYFHDGRREAIDLPVLRGS